MKQFKTILTAVLFFITTAILFSACHGRHCKDGEKCSKEMCCKDSCCKDCNGKECCDGKNCKEKCEKMCSEKKCCNKEEGMMNDSTKGSCCKKDSMEHH